MTFTYRVIIVVLVAGVLSVVFYSMSMPLGVMETTTVMLVTAALVLAAEWVYRRLCGRKKSDGKKDA